MPPYLTPSTQSTKELPKIVASAGISDDVKAKLNHGTKQW